ncbi:hypothetical protein [Nitrospira sp. Nam80]
MERPLEEVPSSQRGLQQLKSDPSLAIRRKGASVKVKGFLIEGADKEELLLSVQPAGGGMFEHLATRDSADTEWFDVQEFSQPSRTQVTMAVLSYLHRLWQMSGPLQVLDH